MTKRKIQRDGRGLISGILEEAGILEEDGQLTVVERDEKGRLIGLVDDRDPAEPVATAQDLQRLERSIAHIGRGTAPPPATATFSDYQRLVRRMSQRLGSRRDGSELHMSILGAVAAVQAGDVERAVALLRAAEAMP